MQLIKTLLLAFVSFSTMCHAEWKPKQTRIVGYLDLSATTVVIYKSERAFWAKRLDSCISGTVYPLNRIRNVAKFVGKKVVVLGYVVKEQYYLSQLGDDIAQIGAPIQNLCRNDYVITIVKLASIRR